MARSSTPEKPVSLIVVKATWEEIWKERIGSRFHPYNQIKKALLGLGARPADIISGSWTHMEESWTIDENDAAALIELMTNQFAIYDISLSVLVNE